MPYCRGGFEHRGRLESRVEALEIFNTDQGSQFTSMDFTGVSLEAEIQISMDGRGRWLDNVFIERLWRSLKHADIYLKHYADGREAKAGISAWIDFYNTKRFHRPLRNRTPMAVQHGAAAALAGAGCGYVDNARALPTALRRPFHQASLDATFGQRRPQQK